MHGGKRNDVTWLCYIFSPEHVDPRVISYHPQFSNASQYIYYCIEQCRVTWGIAPPFGDDLSLTYLFASTSEKSYIYVTNYMLCV